ncbi:MAG: asparaginase [Ideonella sp.]
MSLPRVLVVSLGGTITMTSATGPGAAAGIVPTLDANQLIEGMPQLERVAQLSTTTLFGLPGASLTLPHLYELARLLRDQFDAGMDGAVVVQGTDTIEETAFVLDMLHRSPQPVVVTGAMRGPQSPGADGPANLLAAIVTAGSPVMQGKGVVAVLNDEIHAAQWVQKFHTTLASAFASPAGGPIGSVVEGQVHSTLSQPRSAWIFAPEVRGPCEVALMPLGLGEDGRQLASLAALGYAGAVVEGMGAGHIPAAAVDAVSRLVEQMPVVLATRVRGGRVCTRTYGFAGSEIDIIGRGVIPCGNLSSAKARMLLTMLLANQASPQAIRDCFALQ